MSPTVAAIVVTHNSQPTIKYCIECLYQQQAALERVVVVDSGSTDTSYLQDLKSKYPITLVCTENIGFARANNLGYAALDNDTDYVLFVNPDLFVEAECVARGVKHCEADSSIAMVSGRLMGYDCEKEKANGRIDSTGICRKWYGRWYDRGQGELDGGQYNAAQMMPALCGALLFCRNRALQVMNANVFDPDFFLYKEDVELCLRLRKFGWKLLYTPDIQALHCRGWDASRRAMPLELRLLAAKSEVLLYKKHPSPYMLWALFKYLLVSVFHL